MPEGDVVGNGNPLNNSISSQGGNDRLYSRAGDDDMHAGEGNDLLYGGPGGDTLFGGAGVDRLVGGSGRDVLYGGEGGDSLSGGAGRDRLVADSNDSLFGGAGPDTLVGGEGGGRLVGGTGSDHFYFREANDSAPTQRDVIAAGDGAIAFQGAGLATGDMFDLRHLDADLTTPTLDSFTFGGTGEGQLSLVDSGTSTPLRGNLDDDRSFELQVLIDDGDVRAADYTADDFLLSRA